jgi:uncharacterized protein
MPRSMHGPFKLGGEAVEPGTRRLVDLPVGKLANGLAVSLPVHVLHGLHPGKVMFVSAAIHGDELNGIEIIRRVVKRLQPAAIHGTLMLVPVVNVYGFLERSRYLPDRRDLNRSFPGNAKGPLGSRLADLFMTEIVSKAHLGIDLHTAAVHRQNLPQLRCDYTQSDDLKRYAEAFGTQVVVRSVERSGSLRKAAREVGVDVLVYEGGEGLRIEEYAVAAGVAGIANVMLELDMLQLPDGVDKRAVSPEWRPAVFAHASKWVRAPGRRERLRRRCHRARDQSARRLGDADQVAATRHSDRTHDACHGERGRCAAPHRVGQRAR